MRNKKIPRLPSVFIAVFTLFFAFSAYAIEPVALSASGDDGNGPNNTLDNNLGTRWSANGNGVWIEYDFGAEVTMGAVEIAFYKGDQRSATFEVQSSQDGASWDVNLNTFSSGSTLAMEPYTLNVQARYFRIVGYGNTSNTWTSITEVNFVEGDGPIPPEPPEPPVEGQLDVHSVVASSDDGNVASNTLDGSLSTRWSANGNGQTITYNLGSMQLVKSVSMAFYKGDQRSATFDIQVSPDGSNFSTVFSGESSGSTLALEEFDIPNMPAQFVRIVGYGNSANSWNSITEVEIYGGGDISNVPPVASFEMDDEVSIDVALVFDGSNSFDPDGGSLASYSWDFGDGSDATGAVVNHTYSAGGSYVVSLTVTDDEGDSTTATHAITVDDNKEPPVAVIGAPASTAPNVVLNIDGSASFDPDGGNLASYLWDFGDGTSSSDVSPQKSYSSDGVFELSLTVVDDEGESTTATQTIRVSSVNPDFELWPLVNASFELSTSEGGWLEVDPANVVSMNGTSNPQPPEGGRLLVIDGDGGIIKQAIYKPIAGHVYEITAYVYGHGTIGIQDLGSDNVYETSTAHGNSWQQISVTYVSTGSPAMLYAKYGPGSGDSYFDVFDAKDISTAEDLSKQPPAPIMRYASQVIDLSWWKITLPINNAMEIYTPELLTYEIDPWFKLVEDEDGYAVQFRANHGGSTTGGSSNPRSELRELTQNYHYRNSKSAAAWSNTSGTHEMWIKQKVTHLTYVKPHVVVGQIHDSGDDVTVFRVEGHLGQGGDWDNNGTVGVMDTHANIWITNGNDRHGYLVDDNYELGTVFTVKFIARDGKVEYEYNGRKLDYVHEESFSGAYFKLGNYTQSHNGTAPGETDDAYAETYVYDYYIKHTE
ncbi:polysaccharide lyase family 7 protein [Saccharophagus degradans]|uniref:Polysaccharide lyase family 7 protein n=1 Tax=Saccharophagus degradans TaxID=86304 RepID=A0AAW7X4K7_9GAMM|nr:polysaccharide lyase family 7 protein [Saccharophagus degradans]MDO6421822.1 polysaccharide lyase family 7 protein [Saccharophagus degradans]MDO6606484.1 polysaccharide lyase family 7 protein [Saccharophagus degradans]